MKRLFACAAITIVTMALLPLRAQQVPVTGQMMQNVGAVPAPSTAAVPATPAAEMHPRYANAPVDAAPAERMPSQTTLPASRSRVVVVGDTTRSLLQMQADDSRPGTPLPMLGAEASASYARYLKSFNHDIPDFYETRIGKDNSGGGSSSGAQ